MSSWGRARGAIALKVDGALRGYSDKTSTATLYVPGKLQITPDKLRMWNIDASGVGRAYAALPYTLEMEFTEELQASLDPVTHPDIIKWQVYLDSNSDFEFSIDTTQATDAILKQSGIPAVRRFMTTVFDQIDAYAASLVLRSNHYRSFSIVYKDPCVIPVPDTAGGGYLMVLMRYRIAEEDSDTNQPDKGKRISDIVCYWSRDPSFNGEYGDTLKGPFLLVHSSDALTDPYLYDEGASYTNARFRPYLGVPGAVFVGNDLYLYYVAEPNYNPGVSTKPYLDAEAGAAVGAFNNDEGLRSTLVYRVIRHANFVVDIYWGLGDTDEANWTVRSAISGGPNLPVRAWMAVSGARWMVDPFEEQVLAAAAETDPVYVQPKKRPYEFTAALVDPAPFVCDDQLGLFVAVHTGRTVDLPVVLGSAGKRLYGLWRLRGLAGVSVNDAGTPIRTERGRDFVVSGPLRFGSYPDQVAEGYATRTDRDDQEESAAGEHYYEYLDPDVVYVPELGVWRIYTHVDGELVYFEASEDRVCMEAFDAWDGGGAVHADEVDRAPALRPL